VADGKVVPVTAAVASPLRAAGKLMQRAALASLVVSVLLVLLKAVAYLMTDSVAMLSALADSGLDVFTSAINLVAVHQALQPADAEHRFGHGKAEPLAGLAQGAFIAGSATFLVIAAINRFIEPHAVEHGAVAIAVMVFSIGAASSLVIFQRIVVAQTKSVAIGADLIHYLGDVVTNVAVLAAILLATLFHLPLADPIVGLGVAVFLAWNAWSVFHQSYDQLMDRELPDGERDRIKAIVMRHDDVLNMHDLRTRAAGISTFIQVHIELDPAISLTRAHEVSDAVEADILSSFPNAEVIIHQDPAGVEMPAELERT
jgi:ferrous-iron efflux pump FieF